MTNVVVIIPVHKEKLSSDEILSLKQCGRTLNKYDIRIIHSSSLNTIEYKKVIQNVGFVEIEPKWFSSIKAYNELKKSKSFYSLFRDYEYLLTYELDTWVFRDELTEWCNKGYDFIGAPLFEDVKGHSNTDFKAGRNSGFSLRKISTCLRILNRLDTIIRFRKFWYHSKIQSIIPFENPFFEKTFGIKFTNYFKGLWGGLHYNEDAFWARYVPATFPQYKLASIDECIKFSFERRPSFLFSLNDEKLPFGCHAWMKHEPEFWKKYIKTYEI